MMSFNSLQFLSCCSPRDESAPRLLSVSHSIKRETNILDEQPHLISPMKLRVYDDLPATPIMPEHSQLGQWGRNLASRASSRASRISVKKRTPSKSMISRPQPLVEFVDARPVRRRREFTPLQLSIYYEENRLSDLPAFDRLSFTEVGEIKAPPKALVRTQSEGVLRKQQRLVIDLPKRTNSMFETGNMVFARPGTSHSIVSTSRPPSEYDALHSHPVSWASLPGIPAAKSQKHDNVVSVMTPMQEEFSPIVTTITVDGTTLNFPRDMPADPETEMIKSERPPTPETQAPYPVVSQGPSGLIKPARSSSLHPFLHNNESQTRVNHWLQYRDQSESTSTITSVSTTQSFAEHRRKRSEFYQLGNQQAQLPPAISVPVTPPEPLDFVKPPRHARTNTESTYETVDTSVLESDTSTSVFSPDPKRDSQDTMTTYSYSVSDVKSQSGTVKSVASPCSLSIITPSEYPPVASPALSADVFDHRGIYLHEINGVLRSPGVGIAF